MAKQHEFIARGEEVFLLTKDTKTISLTEAVGTLAMSTYENMMNLKEAATSEEEKKNGKENTLPVEGSERYVKRFGSNKACQINYCLV